MLGVKQRYERTRTHIVTTICWISSRCARHNTLKQNRNKTKTFRTIISPALLIKRIGKMLTKHNQMKWRLGFMLYRNASSQRRRDRTSEIQRDLLTCCIRHSTDRNAWYECRVSAKQCRNIH